MTNVIIIRHGQSLANLASVFAGHFDVGLSDLGHKQAEKTAAAVNERFKIDKIYSSDLKRAYETAQPLARLTGKEIIPDVALREIYAGKWEGRLFNRLVTEFADDYGVWRNDIGNARCTGGESTREAGERMLAAVRRIALENDGKTVAITTHAAVIRAFMALCSGEDFSVMKDIPFVANASYNVLFVDGDNMKFTEISRDDHLEGLKSKLPANV